MWETQALSSSFRLYCLSSTFLKLWYLLFFFFLFTAKIWADNVLILHGSCHTPQRLHFIAAPAPQCCQRRRNHRICVGSFDFCFFAIVFCVPVSTVVEGLSRQLYSVIHVVYDSCSSSFFCFLFLDRWQGNEKKPPATSSLACKDAGSLRLPARRSSNDTLPLDKPNPLYLVFSNFIDLDYRKLLLAIALEVVTWLRLPPLGQPWCSLLVSESPVVLSISSQSSFPFQFSFPRSDVFVPRTR